MTNLSICLAAFLVAQAKPAAVAPSVWDLVVKGGPVMIPIGFGSLVALGLFVERVMSLRRDRVLPPGLVNGLRGLRGDDEPGRARALELCRDHPSPLANILAVGVAHYGQPAERVERRIAEAGEREVYRLRKYLRALSLIASVSTLLGLLGTITGMIQAFQTIAASAEAMGRTELLAKGIYEAMVTTAGGLIVAIPTLVAYHWLAARIDRLVADMDDVVVEFVEPAPKPVIEAVGGSPRLAVASAL